MATEEELEEKETEAEDPGDDEGDEPAPSSRGSARDDAPTSERGEDGEARALAKRGSDALDAGADPDAGDVLAPTQLGTKRFVYAAYFAGGIAVAFFVSKIVDAAWQRLSLYKPQLGEPHDEVVMPIAALIGAGVAWYYWKRTRARALAEEVADELSKVTWPNRDEVTSSTAVVIVTTALATIFFALMDRFWGFVTNLVYGT